MAKTKVVIECALIVIVVLLMMVESKSPQRKSYVPSKLVIKKTIAHSTSTPRPTYHGPVLRVATSPTKRNKYIKALENAGPTTTSKSTTRSLTTLKPTTRSLITSKPTTRSLTTSKSTARSVTTPKSTRQSVTTPKSTGQSVTTPKSTTKAFTTFKTTRLTPTSKVTIPTATSKSTSITRSTPRLTSTIRTTSKSTRLTAKTTSRTGTTAKSTSRTTPRTHWTQSSSTRSKSSTFRTSTSANRSTPSRGNHFLETLLQCSVRCRDGLFMCRSLSIASNSLYNDQQYCQFMTYQRSGLSTYKCLLDSYYCTAAEYHKLKVAACNKSVTKNPLTFLIAIFAVLTTTLRSFQLN